MTTSCRDASFLNAMLDAKIDVCQAQKVGHILAQKNNETYTEPSLKRRATGLLLLQYLQLKNLCKIVTCMLFIYISSFFTFATRVKFFIYFTTLHLC